MHGDLNQHILRTVLGIFYKYIEIFILVKNAGIYEFKFGFAAAAAFIFIHQPGIRILLLRILVQHFLVGMRGCIIKIII